MSDLGFRVRATDAEVTVETLVGPVRIGTEWLDFGAQNGPEILEAIREEAKKRPDDFEIEERTETEAPREEEEP
jgi:hypothetical protein